MIPDYELIRDSEVEIGVADLSQPAHQAAVLAMTDAYAADPMGNDGPLPDEVRERLIVGLRAHPTTVVLLAWAERQPIGIATCFVGFSTFAARPVINVHDLAVVSGYRGRGVGRRLLQAVEAHARKLGCAKLTLEVQESNARARRLYESVGFHQPVYGQSSGPSLFYAKALNDAQALNECER